FEALFDLIPDPLSFPPSPEVTSLPRLARQGAGSTPFPSLAPPITLLVEGRQQTLVVCLVLDVASPALESSIWFSAGNGSFLDAFTYGPSPAADGTWTSLAQLSLPSEEMAAWETLVCHTGPGPGDPSQSTQPLQLSGGDGASQCASLLRGHRAALRLEALRLLLFKLLLLDVLLTCSRLRAPPAAREDTAQAIGPGDPGLPASRAAAAADRLLLPQPLPGGSPAAPTDWIRRSDGGTPGRGLSLSAPPALQPQDGRVVHTRGSGRDPRSPACGEGPRVLRAWRSRPAVSIPASSPGAFVCDLPPLAEALSLPSDWKPLEGGAGLRPWDI
uniref:Pre T-cell antigen receptor alpha n=1 Tax=Catagonus wagneri TaxID=51154 RepID=A0A8C3X5F6_9CETA